jgi:hypothetical protein
MSGIDARIYSEDDLQNPKLVIPNTEGIARVIYNPVNGSLEATTTLNPRKIMRFQALSNTWQKVPETMADIVLPSNVSGIDEKVFHVNDQTLRIIFDSINRTSKLAFYALGDSPAPEDWHELTPEVLKKLFLPSIQREVNQTAFGPQIFSFVPKDLIGEQQASLASLQKQMALKDQRKAAISNTSWKVASTQNKNYLRRG